MAKEEEAREAADGKEVQAETVDLEPFHMQTQQDSKLSSLETKNVEEIIGSTEATSEIKLPLEHNINDTSSSSLNGHVDEENTTSNEQLHEDSKKDHEQVQAALDGESTDQYKKFNKEANDCLNHGETTTEDSSLLKHKTEDEPKGDDQQDEDPMPETSKTHSDIDQSQLVLDQLEHNMDLAKATEDTQPECMENISNAEVVTEASAGVQGPLDSNLDDSDATLDTADGSKEKDEVAREKCAIHREHREIFPEDISSAKQTEDQQSMQADTTDADAVQEDIAKCEETGVPEEIPKSEHADGSIIDAQEEFHQEPSEDTNDPVYGKEEQISQQSSMTVSDDITSEHDSTNNEPPVDIQVQNKKLLEEMKDAGAVDTEAAMQLSCVAFVEAIPQYHVPTTEQDSVETNSTKSAENKNVKTVSSSEVDKVENIERGPTSGSQEVDNVGSTEEVMDSIDENIVEATHVATVDEANKEKNTLRAEDIAEKHVPGIKSKVTKSTEPVEAEEDSDQRHVSLLDDSTQEDSTSVSEKQQKGSALEINETEATRTEAVPKESNGSVSEEPSPEDYVTESETTCDTNKVNTTESLEATEGGKDAKNRETSDHNMESAGKSTQASNAPESEPTSEIQPEQEPESEEIKGTESSSEINATVFHQQTQENNPTTSELHVTESGGVSNLEATEVQADPQQLSGDHPEEKATEETIKSSEPQTLEPESVEKMNDIEATKPQSISQQRIISPSEESAPEKIAKEDIVTIEPDGGHQQPQDPELAELNEIKTHKSQEIASSKSVSNYEEPSSSEDNVTLTEPNVKGHGTRAGDISLVQEENVETEATVDISSMQETVLEANNTHPVGTEDNIIPSDPPAERMEKETVEIEGISYESPVASIREVAENDILTATTPHADLQSVLKQESVEDKCTDTAEKLRETQQIVSSAYDDLVAPEDNTEMAEIACEIPLQNVIKDSKDAQADEFSNLDRFTTSGEAAQESKLPIIEPTSDVQEGQELGSTQETRGIEGVENEGHQQYRVSTPEEPAVDNKPNVDDHQVHDDKPAELKVNEAMEAEQVLEQSNSSTPDNGPEERIELANDPYCSVQPEQQVESYLDSENNNVLKEEETSDQKIITLEDTATEDTVAVEIDPSVVKEQEHEQKSVQEVKDISANKAEDFHTSQPDSLDKLASESNIATTEPNYDQHLNDIEMKELKSIEGITGGDIYCEQTASETSADTSPTEEHPVESHEENLGNEIENPMLAHGLKVETQTSTEQMDNDFGDDFIQSSGKAPLESSNSTDQIKDEQKAGIEHDSSQKSSQHHVENITDVADKDINGEPVTERGTAESQALIENDAKASQDVTEEGDTKKCFEQTNDHRESGDVEHLPQTCESSVEDEAAQEATLDERHKEAEEVETQEEQLQADEQKHEYEIYDVGNEPLLESKNIENGTTNRTEETDILEAGQTETVVNEIPKIEQALHTSDDSTPSITDTTVEDITGTDKGIEEEYRTNSANILDVDAKMDNQEDQENTEKNNIVPMDPNGEQDETTDEITNEEVGDEKLEFTEDKAVELEATQQKDDASNVATNNNNQLSVSNSLAKHENESSDDVLQLETEGNAFEKADETVSSEKIEACSTSVPEAVTFNEDIFDKVTGSEGGMSDERLKSTDDTRRNLDASSVVAASNEESKNEGMEQHKVPVPAHPIMDENTPKQDMSLSEKPLPTEPEEQEDDQIHKEQDEEDMHEPDFGDDQKEIEQGLHVVETSEHNSVEHDFCIEHEVADEKLESTEDNAVELEATQQKVDASNVDTNNDDQLSISNNLAKHETESAEDVLQFETEGNAFDEADEAVSSEETEACKTYVPEAITFNEDICDKVTESEGGMSDERLKSTDDTRRNLDASLVAALNEESMNEGMEQHKVAVPARPIMDENIPKQEMSLSEKSLPTEPEEQEDDQIHKHDEEVMHEPDFSNDQKEIEQDLPVSNFLMNLILGKENNDGNGHSEPETETKQEETRDDNNCLIIPKQEESSVLPPVQNTVEDKLAAEQEKKDVKCSEEPDAEHKEVEEKRQNITSLEPDAELNKNSQHLELPSYQEKMEDEISNEILSEGAEVFTKMEAKDIVIPNIKQDDMEVDTVSQENTEAATQNENGSLNDARSVNSVSEQALLLTESGMTDAKSLPSEADCVQNTVSDIQDKTIESSSIGATSIPDIQVESEEDKTEEKQPETTATGEVAHEHVDFSNDNPQKSVGPEETSDEQEPQTAEQVSDTEMALGHGKEISEGSSSIFIDKKEDSNVLVKEGNNIQTATEIQADASSMQSNQDQHEAADNKTEMESEKLEHVDFSNDNPQKSIGPEETANEQEPQTTKQVSDTEIALGHEKEISEGSSSIFMDRKEDSNFLVKEGDNIQTATEIQADASSMQVNQDQQEAADDKTDMESEKLEESNIQEQQGNGTEQKAPKECHEEQEFLVKEEDAHETVTSHTETVKIKSNDEHELTDSNVQERDLNVSPPKEVPDPKESFVYIAKPDFSTDEKQSPKVDESNISELKTYEGKIQNFTDETMKTEVQVAGQKAAHKKKPNLLSGVGTKVKQQLAKVKKVITGKPGHTKPESPKS